MLENSSQKEAIFITLHAQPKGVKMIDAPF
jgi:hypothetical protein